MKSTMKRCLAFATVLAMLLSVCALPVFAVNTVIAEPCEHAANVEPETVIITSDDNTHSRYDKYECGECGAKWIANVVLGEAHDYENVETEAPAYPTYEADPETGAPVLVDDGKGVSTPTCTICGHEDTANVSEIPALVHSKYEELTNPDGCCKAVVTPATCDEDGSIVYVCDSDGKSYFEAETLTAPGHAIAAAPTCDGVTITFICTNDGCDESVSVDIVTEAPAHEENCGGTYEVVMSRAVNCVEYGYTVYACTNCDVAYATDYVAAAGHNTDGVYEYTAQSCTEDRVIVRYCTACVTIANNDEADEKLLVEDAVWNLVDANGNYGLYAKETDGENLATGHYYMDGETRVDIDPNKHYDDVVCAGTCGATFSHAWVEMETPATCTEPGATWQECECGEEKGHTPIDALDHTEILDEENSYKATDVADGLNVYICEVCGEKTREDEVLYAPYDIVFSAAAKNQFGGNVYVNNGIIAYTVSLNAANLAVGAIKLEIAYNMSAFTYMGYDLGDDNENAFGAYAAEYKATTTTDPEDANGNVIVTALSLNYAEGAVVPVVLDGEQEFVTLYFAINSEVGAGEYELHIASYDVKKVDQTSYTDYAILADVAAVKVEMLGDLVGNDGMITIEDLMAVNDLIASSMDENAPLYDVHGDINQDGIVDFEDLYAVNMYINNSYTLEELLAIGDVRPGQNG